MIYQQILQEASETFGVSSNIINRLLKDAREYGSSNREGLRCYYDNNKYTVFYTDCAACKEYYTED